MQRAESVDEYIDSRPEWAPALRKLRKILTTTELEETVKWGGPCYTLDGKNVVGLGAFRDYAGLWFHQGVNLQDPDGVLVNAQEGKTRALRQWRFTSAAQIKVGRVRAYVLEAIENQREGKVVRPERGKPVTVPPELRAALAKKPRAKQAFDAMTPGKRREYAEHVASAKLERTRLTRVAKVLPMIEAGRGLNDKYRSR